MGPVNSHIAWIGSPRPCHCDQRPSSATGLLRWCSSVSPPFFRLFPKQASYSQPLEDSPARVLRRPTPWVTPSWVYCPHMPCDPLSGLQDLG